MSEEQEDLLDEVETPGTSEGDCINSDIEKRLTSSVTKQLIMGFLERRAIELGATEKIENFCSDMQKRGKSNFLDMRSEALDSFQVLMPRPLRLDILQMATEFVDQFFKSNGSISDNSLTRVTHSDHFSSVEASVVKE